MSLTSRVARGGIVLIAMRLSIRLIGLISLLALFRILSPDDFGLVAIAMLVVALTEVLTEFGFEQVLIQKTKTENSDYNLAWSLSIIRGTVCAITIVLLAGPAAKFLNEPRLLALLPWLAIGPIIDGLQNTRLAAFARDLDFSVEFRIKVCQKIFSFLVTLGAALLLKSYWALVIGVIFGKTFGLVGGYFLDRYKPKFTLKGWKDNLSLSGWLLFSNVVGFVGSQTDKLLIQKFYDSHLVGIVRIAEEMSSLVMELIWPVEKSLLAGYSKACESAEKLRELVLRSTALVALISVPMSIGVAIVAEPLVHVLLGEKGVGAIPFIQILAIHGALRSCVCGILPVFMATGQPRVNAELSFFTVVLRIIFLLILFPLIGAMAAPWALVGASFSSIILIWRRSSKILNISLWRLPASLWRTFAAVLAMVFSVEIAHDFLRSPGYAPLTVLASLILVGIISYIASISAFWAISGFPRGPETSAWLFIKSPIQSLGDRGP